MDEVPIDDNPDAEDEAIGFLEHVESAFRRMIHGVIRYLFATIPIWFRERYRDFVWLLVRLRDWISRLLNRFFRYAIRLLVRLSRASFFGGIWGVLVFGPGFYLGSRENAAVKGIGILWTALCIVGSIRALARWKQHATNISHDDNLDASRIERIRAVKERVLKVLVVGGFVLLCYWIALVFGLKPT